MKQNYRFSRVYLENRLVFSNLVMRWQYIQCGMFLVYTLMKNK